jgi:hypothetical protein
VSSRSLVSSCYLCNLKSEGPVLAVQDCPEQGPRNREKHPRGAIWPFLDDLIDFEGPRIDAHDHWWAYPLGITRTRVGEHVVDSKLTCSRFLHHAVVGLRYPGNRHLHRSDEGGDAEDDVVHGPSGLPEPNGRYDVVWLEPRGGGDIGGVYLADDGSFHLPGSASSYLSNLLLI